MLERRHTPRPEAGAPEWSADRPQRTGATRIEALAVARVRASVAAMPASLVVQLALWPDELARWARAERIAESVVYNLLARRKPYLRIRERLAAHLGVPTGHLAGLVDRPAAAASPAAADAPTATGGLRVRDGGNPIERRAVERVALQVAAMPAATVIGLALWPESLTAWARAQRVQPSAVWATLAGAVSEPVAAALARRLEVAVREVVALVEAERRRAGSAPELEGWAREPAPDPAHPYASASETDPDPPPAPRADVAAVATPGASPGARATRPRTRPTRDPRDPRDQLSLGL